MLQENVATSVPERPHSKRSKMPKKMPAARSWSDLQAKKTRRLELWRKQMKKAEKQMDILEARMKELEEKMEECRKDPAREEELERLGEQHTQIEYRELRDVSRYYYHLQDQHRELLEEISGKKEDDSDSD